MILKKYKFTLSLVVIQILMVLNTQVFAFDYTIKNTYKKDTLTTASTIYDAVTGESDVVFVGEDLALAPYISYYTLEDDGSTLTLNYEASESTSFESGCDTVETTKYTAVDMDSSYIAAIGKIDCPDSDSSTYIRKNYKQGYLSIYTYISGILLELDGESVGMDTKAYETILNDVVIKGDKIILVGSIDDSKGSAGLVDRYDGYQLLYVIAYSFDESSGLTFLTHSFYSVATGEKDTAYGVDMDDDGNIVVVGDAGTKSAVLWLKLEDVSGTYDLVTVDTVTKDFVSGESDYATRVKIQTTSTGTYAFVAGNSNSMGTSYIAQYELTSTGLDYLNAFSLSPGDVTNAVKDISVNEDGYIVTTGYAVDTVENRIGMGLFTFDSLGLDGLSELTSNVSTGDPYAKDVFLFSSDGQKKARVAGFIESTINSVFVREFEIDQDADGDGFTLFDTDEEDRDCNDEDASIHPGGTEVCDGVDNDCDGTVDDGVMETYYYDGDGDGYGSSTTTTMACAPPILYVTNSDDCDDTNAGKNPAQSEVCDDIDNDCDALIDEADDSLSGASTWFADNDRDGRGSSASGTTVACSQPTGYASTNTDCDDTDSTIYPGRTEVCDGKDNDCDGTADDSPVDGSSWYIDADSDTYGSSSISATACTAPAGYVSNDDDCDDSKPLINPGADEVCDDVDNDCDGEIDEPGALGASVYQYRDADRDLYGNPSVFILTCKPVTLPGYTDNDDDCNDANYGVNPDGIERCDGLDNDCDGTIDDGFPVVGYYRDQDGDTYGSPTDTILVCGGRPAGYVSNNTDCDDADTSINPAAAEICDGKDNDCNSLTDESGSTVSWYADSDGDGYGDASTAVTSCASPGASYVTNGEDCDDTSLAINPGATEICDLKDNDCDGGIDDSDPDGIPADALTWYEDSDADGYGNSSISVVSCEGPAGYQTVDGDCDDTTGGISPAIAENEINCGDGIDQDCSGDDLDCSGTDNDGDGYFSLASGGNDCDDTDPSINPGAFEVCDDDATGIDENCDGLIDDEDPLVNETTKTTWYLDTDEDTFGSLENGPFVQACDQPAGYVSNDTDCNDNDPAISPLASEVCEDSIDNDCDTEIDEDCSSGGTDTSGSTGGEGCTDPQNWYPDVDLDGFGDSLSEAVSDCTAPEGYVDNNTDCDDADDTVNPDASEECSDTIDNDCDGDTNEGCGTDSSGSTDSGTSDSGTSDAGTSDSGSTDSGASDSGSTDSGTSDSGTSDAGTSDSGSADSGASDSGSTDSGTSDSGTSDSGTSDAGTSDSGSTDSGVADGSVDSSSTDAGATDSGTSDSGTVDVGGTDSGATDVGGSDGIDAGVDDSGATDVGATDSGTTDTGVTDTGASDTGMTDSGSTGSTETGTSDSGSVSTGTDTGVSPSEPGPEGDGDEDGPNGLSLKPSSGCSLILY